MLAEEIFSWFTQPFLGSENIIPDNFSFESIPQCFWAKRCEAVLCAQIDDAGFKALVERVIDDDVLAACDEFISDMCADVTSASSK